MDFQFLNIYHWNAKHILSVSFLKTFDGTIHFWGQYDLPINIHLEKV